MEVSINWSVENLEDGLKIWKRFLVVGLKENKLYCTVKPLHRDFSYKQATKSHG